MTSTVIVLIHGGGCTSACWRDTLPLFRHQAMAVDLPGRGRHPADLDTIHLREGAASVIADLERTGCARAIFAGHSLGGAMVNELAGNYPERTAGLIFIGVPFPQQGGNVASACTAEVQAGFQAARQAGVKHLPTAARVQAAALFGNDMDEVMITRMYADLVPESLNVFFEPLDLSGLRRGIPSLYVKLTQDAAAPPSIQDAAIAAIRPDQVTEIASGHMAMYTKPAELATAIDDWIDLLNARHT